jgi:hypothetical protein
VPSVRTMDPEPTPLDAKTPEELFPGDLEQARHIFHTLAATWHPDRNKAVFAQRVFQHINELYQEAVRRIETETWRGQGLLSLPSGQVPYFTSFPFELGHTYIGHDHVTYTVDPKHEALFNHALRVIHSFKYADDSMKREFSRYLPSSYQTFVTPKRLILKIAKDPTLVRLRDVVRYYDDKLDPKHMAWVISSLSNIACYLSYAKVVHHDISLDSYFIAPKDHNGALLGGWWYAQDEGDDVSVVPTRTSGLMPASALYKKTAAPLTDLELIRAVGRELLGDLLDAKPSSKKDSKIAPEPVVTWLKSVADGTAVENYSAWKKVLVKGFGPPKFNLMELDESKLYHSK